MHLFLYGVIVWCSLVYLQLFISWDVIANWKMLKIVIEPIQTKVVSQKVCDVRGFINTCLGGFYEEWLTP